jgi:hypothetical protein
LERCLGRTARAVPNGMAFVTSWRVQLPLGGGRMAQAPLSPPKPQQQYHIGEAGRLRTVTIPPCEDRLSSCWDPALHQPGWVARIETDHH